MKYKHKKKRNHSKPDYIPDIIKQTRQNTEYNTGYKTIEVVYDNRLHFITDYCSTNSKKEETQEIRTDALVTEVNNDTVLGACNIKLKLDDCSLFSGNLTNTENLQMEKVEVKQELDIQDKNEIDAIFDGINQNVTTINTVTATNESIVSESTIHNDCSEQTIKKEKRVTFIDREYDFTLSPDHSSIVHIGPVPNYVFKGEKKKVVVKRVFRRGEKDADLQFVFTTKK